MPAQRSRAHLHCNAGEVLPARVMNILSIQSEVVYGHVGNRAARFALERLSHAAWTVPTILLSSHAGYARVEGEATSADLMRRLIDGLDGNGWLGRCDA